MTRRRVVAVVCIVALIAASAITLYASSMRESHPPIDIFGDYALEGSNGTSQGVVRGNGTSINPFVIEGWDIVAPAGGSGISIMNTHYYVIIRDVRVHADHESMFGIHLEEAVNVRIEHSTFEHNWNGIRMDDCRNVSISHCHFTSNLYGGTEIFRSQNVSVTNNVATSNAWNLRGWAVDRCDITGNEFRHGCVKLESTSNSTFSDNFLRECPMIVSGSPDLVMENNDTDRTNIIV